MHMAIQNQAAAAEERQRLPPRSVSVRRPPGAARSVGVLLFISSVVQLSAAGTVCARPNAAPHRIRSFARLGAGRPPARGWSRAERKRIRPGFNC
jgi:hypothetical protein